MQFIFFNTKNATLRRRFLAVLSHTTSRAIVTLTICYAIAGFSKLDHSSFLRVFSPRIYYASRKSILALDPLSTRRGFIRSSRFETRAVYKLSTLVVAERKDECSMPVRSRIHPVLFDGPTVVPTDPFRSIPWNLIVNRPPLSP